MKTLAVVCARKSSKRLKDKHWKLIGGRPMWEWVLRAAHRAGVTRTVASTNDPLIANRVAGYYRDTHVMRPRKLCSDTASIHWALTHVYERLGDRYDTLLCLPGNVPTITPEVINRCIRALKRNKEATAAITVKPITEIPEWMHREEGGFLVREHKTRLFRMQDMPRRYIATGTCAAVRVDVVTKCKSEAAFAWLGPRIVPVVEKGVVIEVHDQTDLELARAWMERR